MSATALETPFSLNAWIDEHIPRPLGPIGNIEVFERSEDIIFHLIRGPNARNDFHICPSDEIFYQLKGHLFLHYLDGDGRRQELRINEGEVFRLPRFVPHSPQRPVNSLGLVIERRRKQEELDSVAWFCENCGHTLYKADYWRDENVRNNKHIIRDFNADKAMRTCKQCGTVLPDPTQR